jgi:trans-2,3-dihydro-3-hydroxyanthranilate isomerase
MGRPSHIALTLVVKGSRLNVVRIGGHAIRVAEGKLTV